MKGTKPGGTPPTVDPATIKAVNEAWRELDESLQDNPRVVAAFGGVLEGSMALSEFEGVVRGQRGRVPSPPIDRNAQDYYRNLSIDSSPRSVRAAGEPREILAAALLMHTSQQPTAEAAWKDRPNVLQAAADLRVRSALDLCDRALTLTGVPVPRAQHELIQAAFSTYSLPSALTLAGDKLLAESYLATPASWKSWTGKKRVANFRQHTSIRPYLSGGGFEVIPPSGELKHSAAGEETYTHQADTYGKMFTIDRRDIVNDDLQAFTELFAEIGRQAPRKIADVCYTTLLGNAGSFFATGAGNYAEGAETALSVASLAAAVTLLRQQKSADGENIGLTARYLVVPPELEMLALTLINSEFISRIADTDELPTGNPWRGRLELEVEPRLSDDDFHASVSTLAWYVFAGPLNPSLVVSYLNGVENPVVEQVQMPGNVLGFGLRGYIDFGVDTADPRAGVKMKGEA